MTFSFDFLGDFSGSNDNQVQDLISRLDEAQSTLLISLQTDSSCPQHFRTLSPPEGLASVPMTTVSVKHSNGVNEDFLRVSPNVSSPLDGISDLIPGQYEGGLKLWECSLDLVIVLEQLHQAGQLCPNRDRSTCRVLELGAGHALPALKAWRLGFSCLSVADFNPEVIQGVTWPNLYHNCYLVDPSRSSQIACFSGDWLCHSAHLTESNTFDLILSAETLYSPESTEKIFYFLFRHLSVGGVALLANKRFYFGVGGGTDELQRVLDQVAASRPEKRFKMELLRAFEDGKSNIRDVLRVTREA